MNPELRKRLQIILLVGVVLAVVRVGYMFYERRQVNEPPPKVRETYSSNLDDYVYLPRVVAFDLKSAGKEMSGKTVWVRKGYALAYYRYNAASHQAELGRKSGVLPPLEKLQIKDVVLQRAPANVSPGQVVIVQKLVLAVVERQNDPGLHAVAVGVNVGDDFKFTANESLFFADPHELYKHWPADVWTAVDSHQAKEGMNELQVEFALGTSGIIGSGEYGDRTLEYANGGHPVTVTFVKNKAVSVVQGKAP